MRIHEAVEKALKEKSPITRASLRDFGFKVFPTDSSDCCYIVNEKQQPGKNAGTQTANDLLAERLGISYQGINLETKSATDKKSFFGKIFHVSNCII